MSGVAAEAAEPGEAGSLVVSGGGTTMVATDDLLAQAAMLNLLHRAAVDWQDRMERIRSLDFEPSPTWRGDGRAEGIYAAARAVDAVEAQSGELADALTSAAEGYGQAERLAELLARYAGAGAGYLLGRLVPVLAALAIPILTGGALALVLASAIGGANPADAPAKLAELVRRNPRLLTNPVLVQAVRVMVSSVDDAAAGAAGVPLQVSFPFGDEGLGLLGAGTSAAGLLWVARPFGLLRESAVSAAPTSGGRSPTRAAPPAGLADLATRIPPASRDGPQVRIERYGPITKPAWVVYIGGTVEWNPRSADEPWDLTSNVAAIAADSRGGSGGSGGGGVAGRGGAGGDAAGDPSGGAGSYRAVVEAMQDAGVGATDPVVQVGHSQGGLIAAQVAASGEFNTVAVATFGAPNGQVHVPDAVPMIRTEHSDDLVPALGGTARDNTAPGSQHLVVRREVYATAELPPGQPVPAHSLLNYRETARMIDESAEPRLVDFRSRLAGVVGGEVGDVSMWRAVRTSR